MKRTSFLAALALSISLVLPASADPVQVLVAAIKGGDKGKIEKALEDCTKATPDKFNVATLADAIKSAAANAKAKKSQEIVLTLCDLAAKRHDVEPQKIIPPLLGSMKEGNDEINSSIEKMFQIKTCHSVNPKKETWESKTSAWRALWNQIKNMKQPNMVFRGFGKAGLQLPPKDSSPASLGKTVDELMKGLDHAELHVRSNSYQFLAHILQPKNFDYDAEGEAKQRQAVINDMKVFYGSNKAKVHEELKKMIDHILTGK